MEGLAKQIALPHEHQPLRFPSFPALERTATLGFSVPNTLNLAASTATKVVLFRQAAYPFWAEQAFTNRAFWVNYQTDQEITGGQIFSGILPIRQLRNWGSGDTTADVYGAGVSGFSSFPGNPYPILGMDAGTGSLPWVYIPTGCIATVVIGSTLAMTQSATATANFEVWLSPGETSTVKCTNATINTGYTANVAVLAAAAQGRWVRPTNVSMASGAAQNWAGSAQLTMLISTTDVTYSQHATTQGLLTKSGDATITTLMPLSYPVEFANSTLPWYATRTTASAFLGTNVTQITKKGGTILAGRVSPNVQSPWLVTSSYVNSLHPAEKAFLPLETGVYTYCPPSTDMSSFYDYTVPTGMTIFGTSCPVFRLDNDALYNVMFITASSDAESLAVTVDWHIEFRTSSALFEVGLCTMSLESLHTAQLSLASAGFFFENPTHGKILGKVVEAAKKYGPGLISMVNPLAGRALKTMMVLSKSPAKTNHMKTTSAEASGLTAKAPKGPKQKPPTKKAQGKKKK
jgi:hypothetical protein